MRLPLLIALIIIYSGLFAHNANAQGSEAGIVPSWMLEALAPNKRAAYELYLKHHGDLADKTAGTAERLIAIYNGQYSSTATIVKEDSADYRYSGTRGMSPNPVVMYTANMRADMLFDTGRSYTRGAAQSSYQLENRAVKSFNALNLTDSVLFEGWTGSGWMNMQKARYRYNASGKEVLATWEGWSPTTASWYNSYRSGYSYTIAGDILADSFQTWDNTSSQWVNNQKTQYTYDLSGRLITMLQHTWNTGNSTWVPASKDSIGYTATGKAASWTSSIFYAASGVWKNSQRDLSFYNSADFEIATVRQVDNLGTGWQSTDSTIHASLNAAGLPQVDSEYINSGTGWSLSQRSTNTYTAGNAISTSFRERMQGGSFSNYYREYFFYNSNNQQTRHYAETWDGTAWSKAYTSEQRFYYKPYATAGTGNPKGKRNLQAILYPVPASTEVTLSLSLSSKQRMQIALYDGTGRMIRSWDEQAGAGEYTRHLSVATLPPGAYTLSVESAGGSWSGSFSVLR